MGILKISSLISFSVVLKARPKCSVAISIFQIEQKCALTVEGIIMILGYLGPWARLTMVAATFGDSYCRNLGYMCWDA